MNSNESLSKILCVIRGALVLDFKENNGSQTIKKNDWYLTELEVERPYAFSKRVITYDVIFFRLYKNLSIFVFLSFHVLCIWLLFFHSM